MSQVPADPHAAVVATAGGVEDGPILTVDGQPLDEALARAGRRARWRAFLLVMPLLVFVIITFITPIGQMLHRAIYNPTFSQNMPRISAWLKAHPDEPPTEEAYALLIEDLKEARKNKTIGAVATRINYDVPGTRSLFTSTARKAKRLKPPYMEAMLKVNRKWGDPRIWTAMRQAAHAYTIDFLLNALDFTRDAKGDIVRVDPERQIYGKLFLRTLVLSLVITGLTLVLGFPIAHLLASLPLKYSNLLMIFVLLPFWTSLLVRTTSWIVLLQTNGVINDILVWLGLIREDQRLQMIFNQTGTVIAMTHILLPFMVLPLYSVMRTIDPSYVRAARSLGATSWTAFRRIYLPQTVPGIGAGALLVFILAVGYYITPALVGGSSGQLISNMIAFHMQKSLNWSLAAALASLLLGGVLILYWLYDKLVGIDNLKLG